MVFICHTIVILSIFYSEKPHGTITSFAIVSILSDIINTMQYVIKKQKTKIALMATKKEYQKAWAQFWAMGRELEKRWKTKKSWLEILRMERDG